MRRHRPCLTFLLVLGLTVLATSAVSAQDWAGRGRVQGIVTNAEKEPVIGAKVTLTLKGEEGQGPPPVATDKKGRWSVLGLATGDWTIVIEAEGYKAAETVHHVVAESVGPGQTLRVTLNPIPKEVAQADQGPNPRAMIERGNALMQEQKWADARTEFQNAMAAIEDKTIHPGIMRGIARTHFEEGHPDLAFKTLEEALAIVPDDQETLRLVVTILMAQGKEAEAATYKSRIVGDFKVDANSLLNLGIQKYNAGDVEGASGYFERVVAENPDLPEGYYYRALVYLNQGKNAEAKADFQKMLALAPDHPKAAEVKEFLAAL